MPTAARQLARSRNHSVWVPRAWCRALLLGVVFLMLSVCHGVVPALTKTADAASVAAAVTDGEQEPYRECAVSKRVVALSDRRGAATQLDIPAQPLGFVAHVPEAVPGLRVNPPPLPENHRAFLQVFRI